ncbi:hypothetical protein ACIXEI_10755 [Bacteroides fragilis]
MKPFRLIVNGGNTHIQEYKKRNAVRAGMGYNHILYRLPEQV